MTDRLTEAELATMRAEHVQDYYGDCATCWTWRHKDGCIPVRFPCDAARLLAHFAPGPVPHLAGIEAKVEQ